jgi:hypothetical protein
MRGGEEILFWQTSIYDATYLEIILWVTCHRIFQFLQNSTVDNLKIVAERVCCQRSYQPLATTRELCHQFPLYPCVQGELRPEHPTELPSKPNCRSLFLDKARGQPKELRSI